MKQTDVKLTKREAILLASASLVPLVASTVEAHNKATLTPEVARSLAQEAWLFGVPLVYIATQVDVLTHVLKPEGSAAPINQFVHYREFPDPTNRLVVGFNVDTLYSLASLDLSQEPIVLTVPNMGTRYWVMQLVDGWNNVSHAPGSRTVGGKGGDFAIVGPDWQGTLPPGLTELRMPTSIAMVGGRTYTADKDDYSAVHVLQDKYKLIPLHAWGKPYAPPDDVPLKSGVDSKTPVPEQVLGMTSVAFFGRLNALLVDNPPEPADPTFMARIAQLGITPGAAFSTAEFSPEVLKAIEEGVAAGVKQMRETVPGKKVNGWVITLDMGRYGTNYPYRAYWTFFGVGGNLAEDAVYPLAQTDGDGVPLDGANKYILHFAKSEIPPVNAFWSVTMYDIDGYLVANPINRNALGDRSAMTFGSDGSLSIYVQNESPGPDKEANWLPAPGSGKFKLALRLYAPRKEVMDGKWAPPPVMRV
ncbi:DUF1254 domain-containing protein [Candidatus Phycosocius spiralis]|uniref:DUF1254 domain-containing protein n=1 Tax=Candidatus Phycosocius spiralis TaxID=2815099 RepID=A0ABQ4PSJ2_9PROT|nr:DUF1254 domain-containing protein [Candidatus Phycosocius spiralis]GIU65946.1 hypothetical protein PsB1_0100 [Candidatus Phycosocius spiralis]